MGLRGISSPVEGTCLLVLGLGGISSPVKGSSLLVLDLAARGVPGYGLFAAGSAGFHVVAVVCAIGLDVGRDRLRELAVALCLVGGGLGVTG